MNTQKEIPVFFTIDNSYAPFLAAALHSAITNSSKERSYRAIVLYQDLNEENRKKLQRLEKEHFAIEFIPMGVGLECITDRMSNRLRCDYFTLTIYFRLFIPDMFPQYEKGIYIDSDVILLGDLAELYDTDIGENYIGACNDLSVQDIPPLCDYMEQAVGVNRKEYINSGVLLMNLKKLREAELDHHFLTLLNRYHLDCIAPDQDYLNALCNGNIYYLDPVWDAMPNDNQPPVPKARLIHYNLFSKPWCYDNIQYGEYFWRYAQNCGYLEEIRAYKEQYSDEQKESDKKCLKLLVERGAAIAESEITFKKLYEQGEKIRL